MTQALLDCQKRLGILFSVAVPLRYARKSGPTEKAEDDIEIKGRSSTNLAGKDAKAKDGDDAKFTGGKRLDEVWNEATEHHHGASNREADPHGANVGLGPNARERLVLAIGVKAREATNASIAVAIK